MFFKVDKSVIKKRMKLSAQITGNIYFCVHASENIFGVAIVCICLCLFLWSFHSVSLSMDKESKYVDNIVIYIFISIYVCRSSEEMWENISTDVYNYKHICL